MKRIQIIIKKNLNIFFNKHINLNINYISKYMPYKIEKIDYKNKKDNQLLEIILKNWFKNPKELNLTSPSISYPFKYKKWLNLYNTNDEIHSFVMKSSNWIIGIGNLKILNNSKRCHAFHIFIDPDYRKQGLAAKIIRHLEKIGNSKGKKIMTLKAIEQNTAAISLYKKLNFIEQSLSKKTINFLKKI
tara:strand:- start:633 stop:1196 length:564 start_codon:yes stop_codon:yes gene_type:complete